MIGRAGSERDESASGGTRPRGPVALRPTGPADLRTLFQHQLDPDANRMAVTRPRDEATYFAHWAKVLADDEVVPRTILVSGEIVGSINRFPREGAPWVGYWIDKEHWGRGIATEAIRLFLLEVATRPLHARVARSNVASMRALLRNGFVITHYLHEAETERFPACESAHLVLER